MSEHDDVMRYLALLPHMRKEQERHGLKLTALLDRLGRMEERMTIIEQYYLDTSHDGVRFYPLEDDNE